MPKCPVVRLSSGNLIFGLVNGKYMDSKDKKPVTAGSVVSLIVVSSSKNGPVPRYNVDCVIQEKVLTAMIRVKKTGNNTGWIIQEDGLFIARAGSKKTKWSLKQKTFVSAIRSR